ncbi:hypothetical protein L6452_11756 [Arctium lappa]|uniref:Uncharacterized protein n=1 Tax=Arctium lappa TaxID=4217 RepID=A0ACB9DQ94_ARCLA|nr:hypothetical protein L6452_11756 [Arctium lappa]
MTPIVMDPDRHPDMEKARKLMKDTNPRHVDEPMKKVPFLSLLGFPLLGLKPTHQLLFSKERRFNEENHQSTVFLIRQLEDAFSRFGKIIDSQMDLFTRKFRFCWVELLKLTVVSML